MDHNAAKLEAGTIAVSPWTVEADDLIFNNIAVLRDGSIFIQCPVQIVTHTGDKKDARFGPFGEQFVIDVGQIHDDDGTWNQGQEMSDFHVGLFGSGDQNIARQVIVMVQQDVS